jgi:CheY-like chemotaxis protein
VINDRKKIIVVDDNLENLTAIKNTLKSTYDVYPSPSASKMFELLERFLPHLIILDVEMPVMNGYEAAKILKTSDKFREIPLMFLTSMNDAKSEMEGLNIGAVDYIHKPFVAPLLIRRIQTQLSLMDHQRVIVEHNAAIEELLAQKTREIELRKAAEQEAQSASRAKGDFLSHMSHEIRTPLNAIIGMIGIARSTNDIQKIKYSLEKADSASKHMLGIINDILDMSKIEANKFELAHGEFNFEKMLIDIINVTNIRAEEKHQNLVVNLNINVPPFIVTDELRLSQVITNLLSNAIKFTPENGKVILNIEKIDDTDDTVTLKTEVADTGIGISEEQQRRLFSSYNQADAKIVQKFGGTGLGLAISKHIVDLMQGQIWIESELNKGAKFIFKIKEKKGTEKINTKLSEKIDMNDVRILAVDDSEETRTYFVHVMESFRLPCDAASGGAEALELIDKAADRPYNIFFVDWQMPDMDGIELTRRIKKITGDKSFVIMFSMADWSNIEKEALMAGVNQFLPKPLFPSMLINAINGCIEVNPKKDSWLPDEDTEAGFDFSEYTILIAEDVEINREIVAAMLERTSVSIDFAENGKEAVSQFREHPDKYGLILMDVNMPEMDGFEATQAIRAFETEQSMSFAEGSMEFPKETPKLLLERPVPIIAMTANVFREDIEKCLSAGMNGHIGKPISPEVLYEKLKEHLQPLLKPESIPE